MSNSMGLAGLWPTLFTSIGQTIYMVLTTLVLAGIFGLAIGVLLYATRKGNILQNAAVFNVLNVLVNVIRPIPFIIFLAVAQPLTIAVIGTSIGTTSVIFPMVLMASFVVGRVVEQNLVAIDPGVIEAARAMGAGKLRVILTVLIPEQLAPLILGYTFMFIGIVDMSAMAGYVGGGGLGNFAIVYGYQQFNYTATLVTVVFIIILVQVAQLIGNVLAKKFLRR
ncbi:ABC transporter permease [Spelaeicoccus albus]|uniref:D-methionine transport system permease protein n=2 Tax=Spelaeicoccus albus TaxID=1280376 RepID=A0A7Z0A881_9MICO|nr:D-methionine transport system permease protein [Spelaeicoccus albus]